MINMQKLIMEKFVETLKESEDLTTNTADGAINAMGPESLGKIISKLDNSKQTINHPKKEGVMITEFEAFVMEISVAGGKILLDKNAPGGSTVSNDNNGGGEAEEVAETPLAKLGI